MRLGAVGLSLPAAILLSLATSATAIAPDPTFGGGIVTTPIGPTAGDEDAAFAMAIQGDGKFVLAGTSNEDFALARYNADGSLDDSFGGDGKVTTEMSDGTGAGPADEAHAIVIQPDGEIVVAGFANALPNSGGLGGDFALARYEADGDPDATFDGDGKVVTEVGTFSGPAFGLALQGDGKLVAAGEASDSGSDDDFALVRYNPDGTLDDDSDGAGFGGDGEVLTDIAPDPSENDQANAVTIQEDGKIVAAGFSNTGQGASSDDFALVRYNPDGTLDDDSDDPGFGGDGKLTTPISTQQTFNQDRANAVTLQDDGKIIAAGSANVDFDQFALVRYNSDGSLDDTSDGSGFGGDGKVTTNASATGGSTSVANAVALQPDGKIVAAGRGANSGRNQDGNIVGHQDFALARYNTNGSLDPTFGGDGTASTGVAPVPQSDLAHAVNVQPDGKIVAAGTADMGPPEFLDFDFALVRYIEVPQTTITSGPSGVTSDRTPSFGFASDEPGSTFECRLDTAPFGPCSGPGNAHTPSAPLGDGAHTFRVRAIDPDGDADPTPASRAFTVGTPSPPGGTPGPGNGAVVIGEAALEDHSVKAKGAIPLEIACAPGPDCEGSVEVETAKPVSRARAVAAGQEIIIPIIEIITTEIPLPGGGTVTGLTGDVSVSGNTVSTGANSTATIRLPSGAVVRLGPNSSATVVQSDGGGTTMRLSGGRMWTRTSSKFEIHTPLAVAGVRGTTFTVEHLGGRTRERTYGGKVRVRNTRGSAKRTRTVKKQRQTVVRGARPPTNPTRFKTPDNPFWITAEPLQLAKRTSFSIPAGETETVRAKLTGKGKKLLKRKRRVNAKATITTEAGGEEQTVTERLKVKAKKK